MSLVPVQVCESCSCPGVCLVPVQVCESCSCPGVCVLYLSWVVVEGIAWCMKHEEDLDEMGELSQSDEDEDEEVPMEEGGGRKLVGDRLREWVTRTETITQSAIDWLEKMDRR